MWESYLVEDTWNCDFHFEMDGVETLHFWWQATTSRKLRNCAVMTSAASRDVWKCRAELDCCAGNTPGPQMVSTTAQHRD